MATSKLDGLMAQVGELLITTMDREERRTELRDVLDSLTTWSDGWKKVRSERDRIDAYVAEARTAGAGQTVDELDRLSWMGHMVEFMREGETRLEDVHARLSELDRTLTATDRRTRQATADLQDEVLSVRMLPVSAVFDSLPRLVRELGRASGKEATLEIAGGETEVDRAVLEQMRGPLTHLIRNALDHGLEAPDVRERAGKPREGRISVAASQRGGTLVVELRDDGAGIDPAAVKAAAVSRGAISAAEAAAMSPRDAIALIFQPGLSTSEVVTDLSGRGVGLDVVRESVERLQGTVEVDSRIGIGTTFTLTLPVTVATTQCLLVRAAGQTFGLPLSGVGRILRLRPQDTRQNQGRRVLVIDDEPVVVTSLAAMLGIDREEGAVDRFPVRRAPAFDRPARGGARRRRPGIPGGGREEPAASAGARARCGRRHHPGLGRDRARPQCGRPGEGRDRRVTRGRGHDRDRARPRAGGREAAGRHARRRRRRRLGGVPHAGEGRAGGRRLPGSRRRRRRGGVGDPGGGRMLAAGLRREHAAARRVAADRPPPRSDARFRDFPVILVTSLDSPEDKARGRQVGADAYIVKSTLTRGGLLEAVRRLI